MPAATRASTVIVGLLLVGCTACAARPTLALSERLSSPGSEGAMYRPAVSDTGDASSADPYATNRSVAYHVLAAPAYAVHAVTRPLGWAARYAERAVPSIFDRELPPRGVLPLADFGGPTGFSGGLIFYDNHLFGSNQEARIRGLYGGSDTFEIKGRYEHPAPFGPGTGLRVRANVFSDPRDRFFRDGNDSNLDTDEVFYSRDQLDATASMRYAPPETSVSGQFDLLYEHVETTPKEGARPLPLAGIGTVDLLTSRVALGLDVTEGRPRIRGGTEVVLQFNYAHDLTADRYRHVRYMVEVRQYLPVGIFPNSRRLALRARLEQVEPVLGGRSVPFYQLPSLGGQNSLRGYRHQRFQNDGSLMLNVEYRYPIWTNWDAVLFTDAGQVFAAFSEVRVDRFRWSYGGGIHMLNQSGLGFRFEVAGSDEGLRTILTVEPTFQRTAR